MTFSDSPVMRLSPRHEDLVTGVGDGAELLVLNEQACIMQRHHETEVAPAETIIKRNE